MVVNQVNSSIKFHPTVHLQYVHCFYTSKNKIKNRVGPRKEKRPWHFKQEYVQEKCILEGCTVGPPKSVLFRGSPVPNLSCNTRMLLAAAICIPRVNSSLLFFRGTTNALQTRLRLGLLLALRPTPLSNPTANSTRYFRHTLPLSRQNRLLPCKVFLLKPH